MRQIPGFGNNSGRHGLHIFEKSQFIVETALFADKLPKIVLEDNFPRIGDRINRVSYAVNQSCPVEGLFIDDFLNVSGHFIAVIPVSDVFADVAHHTYKTQVRAAVTRAFQ